MIDSRSDMEGIRPLFFKWKILLLIPLLLAFSIPAIAHNEFYGGDRIIFSGFNSNGEGQDSEEGEGAEPVEPVEGENSNGKNNRIGII